MHRPFNMADLSAIDNAPVGDIMNPYGKGKDKTNGLQSPNRETNHALEGPTSS